MTSSSAPPLRHWCSHHVANAKFAHNDLTCPFAHVAIHRLFETRARLGLDDAVRLDHHLFPIELLNAAPGTRHGSDSEIPVLGALELDAGWRIWQVLPDRWLPGFSVGPVGARRRWVLPIRGRRRRRWLSS